jgi:hypothetical protein
MGIPPDPYPPGIEGTTYAGRTSFDKSSSPRRRSAEIRGSEGQDVTSLHVSVVPPGANKIVRMSAIEFNMVNNSEPQIVVTIDSISDQPIEDGYFCQFEFHAVTRSK